jgi:hypothetical protein
MLPAMAKHRERVASPPAVARLDHAGVALIRPALRAMIDDDRENRSTRPNAKVPKAKMPTTSITSITPSQKRKQKQIFNGPRKRYRRKITPDNADNAPGESAMKTDT